MRSKDVDQYIQANVAPEFHPVVEKLRALMEECAPMAAETIAYGMPVWRMPKEIAYLTPSAKGITFSFTHGVLFDDPHGHLRGSAKWARYVKLKLVADIDDGAMRDYIRQAVEHRGPNEPTAD